ncbi:MAG: DUF1926 domain-containing protein [Candidatus Eisenbacteria bacterium]|nr:DUF1926 domain-containing protein [Candidatus Eisenbacteria bacterium]
MADKTIRFAMALHAHQPTGNFDHVFRWVFDHCYGPLLEELDRHPSIPFTLHYSGILFEWIEANEPAYLERLRAMVERDQVEVLGGGFGEPILVMLDDEDRRAQLDAMSDYLREKTGSTPRGAWLTERVWEQSLVRDLAGAGLEYTLIDDSIFRLSGLRDHQLLGSYMTEDRGRMIRVFPISERLRYLIPFGTVEETIGYLTESADEGGRRLLVYGDDTEKFGSWPGTYKHVYEDGWLARFFDALEENREVIRPIRLSEALELPAEGRVYMPDASYREMTEWALPTPARLEFEALRRDLGEDMVRRAAPFFRGASWRTFLSKYPESGEMYGRMMEASRRVRAMPEGVDARAEAERELRRAQCNCAYWHGVFGGLYLPHLRSAIHSKLIRAERLADAAARGGKKSWIEAEERDIDFDGAAEIRLANEKIALALHPRRGGHAFAVDDRIREINLSATMTRRPEPYHEEVRHVSTGDDNGVVSIHENSIAKEEGLDRHLFYDTHRRESLVEHFFDPGADLDRVSGGEPPEIGDFVEAPCEARIEREKNRARAVFERVGAVGGVPLRMVKTVELEAGKTEFAVRYVLKNVGDDPIEALFAVESAYALLAGNAPDRNVTREGEPVGPLAGRYDLEPCREAGARDEWLDLHAGYILEKETPAWAFPVETVSLSEGGFEKVFQCTLLLPRWAVALPPGGEWGISIRYFFLPAR